MLKNVVTKKQEKPNKIYAEIGLLSLWIGIGIVLRFTNLTAKPPWTDEFATMAFSLGNTFDSISFNQLLSVQDFLQPLEINSQATIKDIIDLVLTRDNHPPVYFVLAHLWMKWLPSSGEYVNLWEARSLPALLGVLSIPAIYWVGKVAFRSRTIAHMSAAMIAVSSYGIFIAQEARHYTLAIIFVILSLGCFLKATRQILQNKSLSLPLTLGWTLVNIVGISVHYFLSLVLGAELITLLIILGYQIKVKKVKRETLVKLWGQVLGVVFGTAIISSFWIFSILSNGYGHEMTAWIQRHDYPILGMINPPFQLLAAWITMVTLLPVESKNLGIVIFSGLLMLFFFLWAIPLGKQGLKQGLKNPEIKQPVAVLLVFIASLLFQTFTVVYGLGIDITRGARYSFIYFPPLILLLGVILATLWQDEYFQNKSLIPHQLLKLMNRLSQKTNDHRQNKLSVVFVLIVGLLGAITVLSNLGYQKYYLPNQLIPVIDHASEHQPLIVAPYISLSQTGEIMGIAWEAHQQKLIHQPSFMILHQAQGDIYSFPKTLQKENNPDLYPLDVWQVNFYYSSLKLNGCELDPRKFPAINGYIYHHYSCP